MVRKYYIFKGRVQGVGFRFTMYREATRLNLTGWVKNLYDGDVEACIQGDEQSINRLLKAMQSGHFITIESMEVEELEVLPSESSFEMKN